MSPTHREPREFFGRVSMSADEMYQLDKAAWAPRWHVSPPLQSQERPKALASSHELLIRLRPGSADGLEPRYKRESGPLRGHDRRSHAVHSWDGPGALALRTSNRWQDFSRPLHLAFRRDSPREQRTQHGCSKLLLATRSSQAHPGVLHLTARAKM